MAQLLCLIVAFICGFSAYDLWKMPKVSVKSTPMGPAQVKTKFVNRSPTVFHDVRGTYIALNGNRNEKYVSIVFNNGNRELVRPEHYSGSFGNVEMIHHSIGYYSDVEHEKTDKKASNVALLIMSSIIGLLMFASSVFKFEI